MFAAACNAAHYKIAFVIEYTLNSHASMKHCLLALASYTGQYPCESHSLLKIQCFKPLQGRSAAISLALKYVAVCGTPEGPIPWPVQLGVHLSPLQPLAATLPGMCSLLTGQEKVSPLLATLCTLPHSTAPASNARKVAVGEVTKIWKLGLQPPSHADLAVAKASAPPTSRAFLGLIVGLTVGGVAILLAIVVFLVRWKRIPRKRRHQAYSCRGSPVSSTDSDLAGSSPMGTQSQSSHEDSRESLESAPRLSRIDPRTLQFTGSDEEGDDISGESGALKDFPESSESYARRREDRHSRSDSNTRSGSPATGSGSDR
jgi:hypothetical protein